MTVAGRFALPHGHVSFHGHHVRGELADEQDDDAEVRHVHANFPARGNQWLPPDVFRAEQEVRDEQQRAGHEENPRTPQQTKGDGAQDRGDEEIVREEHGPAAGREFEAPQVRAHEIDDEQHAKCVAAGIDEHPPGIALLADNDPLFEPSGLRLVEALVDLREGAEEYEDGARAEDGDGELERGEKVEDREQGTGGRLHNGGGGVCHGPALQ